MKKKSALLYNIYFFIILHLTVISKYKPTLPYIWRRDLTVGFLRYESGGGWLIFGILQYANMQIIQNGSE